MLFFEFHESGTKKPVSVFYGGIVWYEPTEDNKCCRLWLCGDKPYRSIEVEENYDKVNDIVNRFEFVNDSHQMAVQVGTQQYLDFLYNEKSNPIRDEYLRWKGRNEFLSKQRWIDADELLEHVGRDELDTREKIHDLVESLIIKTND